MKADIGLIGLGVMGENLVLNIESKGYTVAVYNRTADKVHKFLEGNGKNKKIIGAFSVEELVNSLKRPRKVLLMVKAGLAVDGLIENLLPYLEEGDIVIDGGNSFFPDTIRRSQALEEKGIYFIGAGISGGEEGALKGPSIMPGGSEKAWPAVAPIFQAIAAKVEDGSPCCQWVGKDGAGHFVKMVHNGIEYADMQLISEAYFMLKQVLGLDHREMQEVFREWNKGDLNSYLIEITRDILGKVDKDTGVPLLEMILDTAGQKGTGKWTGQVALDLGAASPTITEAVFARYLSAFKKERQEASLKYPADEMKPGHSKEDLVKAIGDALYASKICAYSQGFALLRRAAEGYKWNLNYGDIALMWRGGCIIRAQFLQRIKEAFDTQPDLQNLLQAPYFTESIKRAVPGWRLAVSTAVNLGVPIPAFSSALSYFDGYRTEKLPANLIQAQRDYFGAHTYERSDGSGVFHTEWLTDDTEVISKKLN